MVFSQIFHTVRIVLHSIAQTPMLYCLIILHFWKVSIYLFKIWSTHRRCNSQKYPQQYPKKLQKTLWCPTKIKELSKKSYIIIWTKFHRVLKIFLIALSREIQLFSEMSIHPQYLLNEKVVFEIFESLPRFVLAVLDASNTLLRVVVNGTW